MWDRDARIVAVEQSGQRPVGCLYLLHCTSYSSTNIHEEAVTYVCLVYQVVAVKRGMHDTDAP